MTVRARADTDIRCAATTCAGTILTDDPCVTLERHFGLAGACTLAMRSERHTHFGLEHGKLERAPRLAYCFPGLAGPRAEEDCSHGFDVATWSVTC